MIFYILCTLYSKSLYNLYIIYLQKKTSDTGNRTPANSVKASYPNH